MTELGIRVSTNIEKGKGHLVRCLSIRKFLKFKITWFIDAYDKEVIKLLPKKDVFIIEEGNNSCKELRKYIIKTKIVKIVLIDSYNISKPYKEKLSKYCFLASIEDRNKIIDIDLPIIPQPFDFSRVKNHKGLLGLKYAPLDIERKYKKKKNTFLEKKVKILVSMGYYDSKKFTLKIVDAIEEIIKISRFKIYVRVAIGKKSPCYAELDERIKNLKNFKLIRSTNKLFYYAERSDIAIGAPGISHLERLYIGLPTILIPQNSIQEQIVDCWNIKNCCIKSSILKDDIKRAIYKLIENRKLRKNIIKSGKLILDGNGAKRIAKILNSYNGE